MSTLKVNSAQIGQSVTATNNFTWYQPSSPDGTVRLGNGNAGSVTDLVTVNSSGNVGIGTSSPNISAAGTALTILGSSTNRANLELGSTTAAASSVFGQIAGYNGATLASLVQLFGDGATDSGAIKFFTKATGGAITERMRLDSSGNLALGLSSTSYRFDMAGTATAGMTVLQQIRTGTGNSYGFQIKGNYTTEDYLIQNYYSGYLAFGTNNTERMRLDSSGNLGLGVTPSGWYSNAKSLEFQGGSLWSSTTTNMLLMANAYLNASASYIYRVNGAASYYYQAAGAHSWHNAPSGTAGNAISWTQAMTLDASGNLQLGTTSSSGKTLTLKGTSSSGALSVVFNASSAVMVEFNGSSTINGVDGTPNANGLMRIWRDSGNLRSISAAGTLNASGADYAEYMTKAGDFEIAKGDVCGVDASGLLTNVFADAVSFVVKSTDPSYVGNDSWGANIDDKDVLEVARQKVDRIAFAGQVPVNVLGAKAGDYIIPIADGTGIKGTAVASPTFKQYQIAVGKVIAIESDGRARIIVKVA